MLTQKVDFKYHSSSQRQLTSELHKPLFIPSLSRPGKPNTMFSSRVQQFRFQLFECLNCNHVQPSLTPASLFRTDLKLRIS